MSRTLVLLVALVALTLGVSTPALAASDVTECTIKTVKDGGDFENENDFEFAHYKHVTVDFSKAGDKVVLIGALSFSESEEAEPSTFKVVQAYGSTAIEIAPNESDDRFYVRINFRQGTGDFQRLVNGQWVQVAELECK